MAERSTTRISGLLGLAALVSFTRDLGTVRREVRHRRGARVHGFKKRSNRRAKCTTAVRRRRTAKHSRKVNRQWRARK